MELTRLASHARSSQPIYHVHLDPARPWTQVQRDRYWFLFEHEFGLQNQAFVEAVHIKKGREHYHRAYSRVKRDGTVIALSHDYARREKIGRMAEFEFDGEHVAGRHNRSVSAALNREGRIDVVRSILASGLTTMPRLSAPMTPRERHQMAGTTIDPIGVEKIALHIWRDSQTCDLPSRFAFEGLRLFQGYSGPVLLDAGGGVHSLVRVIGNASASTGFRGV